MIFKKFLAVSFLVFAGCAKAQEVLPPATVVVAFDHQNIRPLIVEGFADRTSSRLVDANDPVRIASISKLIMALATLRLVDEGKVDLDADISRYLGWEVRSPNFPDMKLTLRQLLSHRSGLRDRAGYVIPLGASLQAKLANPGAWFADAPPGEAPFEYANLGSPVVATVLEAATGERFDHIIERTVFAPLGIEACLNWIGCSEKQVARAVVLYRDTGEVARDDAADLPPNCSIPVDEGAQCNIDYYVPGSNASIFSPQGGVRIGMMDLAKIGQVLLPLTSEFFSESARQEIVINIVFNVATEQEFFCEYGLAVHQIETPEVECKDKLFDDDVKRIGHAGEAYGLRAGLWLSPELKSGFAYFTTAVPSRKMEQDQGGFHPREIDLMARAQRLIEEGG